MKTLQSLLMALLLLMVLAIPTTAQDGSEGDTVTKTFELTLIGEVPEGDIFVLEYPYPSGQSFGDIVFCGSAATGECVGGGTVYTASVAAAAGSTEKFAFGRLPGGGSAEIFHEGTVVADDDRTISAHYNFQGDEQTDGNQQQDDTVTKTFDLTVSGDTPEGQLFLGFVATREQFGSEGDAGTMIFFCGDVPDEILEELERDPATDLVVASSEACEGGEGTEYAAEVELERGAEIAFVVFREDEETGEDLETIAGTELDEEGLPSEFETIDEDTTNSIPCVFGDGGCGNGEGADDQRMPGMVPDGMMDTIGGGAPDMPNTGAGGIAGGGTPAGAAVAALSALAACGYAVLRRR